MQVTDSPCWRKIDEFFYCNKCALYYKRTGQHKPTELSEEQLGPEIIELEPKPLTEHDIDSFNCSECCNKYKYLSSLKNHANKSHKGVGWQKDYAEVMARAHAAVRDYQCPLCPSKCASWIGLRRHMSGKHEQDKENLQLFYECEELCIKDHPLRQRVLNGDTHAIDGLKTANELTKPSFEFPIFPFYEVQLIPNNKRVREEEEQVARKEPRIEESGRDNLEFMLNDYQDPYQLETYGDLFESSYPPQIDNIENDLYIFEQMVDF